MPKPKKRTQEEIEQVVLDSPYLLCIIRDLTS